MMNPSYPLFILFSFLLISFPIEAQNSDSTAALFHVGLILNLNSTLGKVVRTCISLARTNFYGSHPTHSPKLRIHVRDSKGDIITAASAALDLIKNVGVQGIIGPETSEEAEFIANVGNRAHIPILSFSAISSSLSPTQFPYFVRVAQNDISQVKAIAAIVQAYGWRELSIVHDDSQGGSAAVPFLTDALRDIGTLVRHRTILPSTANETLIKDNLHKLRGMSTRVFIVHLSSSLGIRFFLNVHKEGMMKTGYIWVITCGLTDVIAYMDPSVLHSINGVIGVKTHVPPSKALRKFKDQWRRRFVHDHLPTQMSQPNVYALWAYDVIFLMAMAANRVSSHLKNSLSQSTNNETAKATDLFDTGVSSVGSKFLQSVLATKFTGLSGEVQLVDGQLESFAFRIVNVNGKKDQTIGYWTPRVGLSRSLGFKDMEKNYSANAKDLGDVTWPGGTEVPPCAMKLKIGVPIKTGFVEFMNVSYDSESNSTTVGGFSRDVFEAVMQALPYEYEFIPFPADNYNKLTHQVYLKKFDAVVGDVTIIANRSKYVDFTQPYSLPGVRMIVPRNEDDFTERMWWFTTPLTTELWFTTIAFFVLKGILVWIFEHGERNPEFEGSLSQQLGKVLSFSFSTLVFAHRERLQSNYSRFIVNVWTFAVFILVTCYAANLTSMLTFKNLQVTTLDSLRLNGKSVGYQAGSFVFEFLKEEGFDVRKLKQLSTVQEYANALRNGSGNGGVSAILDELPYIEVFLAKHCTEFAVTGPTYPSGGFGFVFPKDSPLLSDVSKSVLEFTEGESMHKELKMRDIEKRWFGSEKCGDNPFNVTANPLHLYSFESIFIIIGVASSLALFLFFASLLYKRARDGSLIEIFSMKFLEEKISEASQCFGFNRKTPCPCDPRDIQQLQREDELHPMPQVLPDNAVEERHPDNVEQETKPNDEERNNLERVDTPVVEIAEISMNQSEVTAVEDATPSYRRRESGVFSSYLSLAGKLAKIDRGRGKKV